MTGWLGVGEVIEQQVAGGMHVHGAASGGCRPTNIGPKKSAVMVFAPEHADQGLPPVT